MRQPIIGSMLCCIFLISCSNEAGMEVKVNGYAYDVPEIYLLESADVFYLPDSQDDGLQFRLYPADTSRDHVSVDLMPMKGLCSWKRPPATDSLPFACEAAKQGKQNMPMEAWGSLYKVHPFDQAFQWEYRLAGPDSKGIPVAMCSSAQSSIGGFCTSFGIHKNMIYSVRLYDRDIPSLPQYFKEAEKLLSSWEK